MYNKNMKKHLIELHLHTKKNSSCGEVSPYRIARVYARAGYSAIAVTNHFSPLFYDYLAGRSHRAKLKSYKRQFFRLRRWARLYGITVLFGMELSQLGYEHSGKGNPYYEILVYGITPEDITDDIMELFYLPLDQLHQYASQRGWILVQAHPYRSDSILLEPSYVDGIEVHNGHAGHNSHNEQAEARAEQYRLIKTAGSDYHFLGGESSGIYADYVPKTEAQLVDLLKSGSYTIKRDMGKKKQK